LRLCRSAKDQSADDPSPAAVAVPQQTSQKQTLFDAHSASVTPKIVAPESEQEPNESRRLWSGLTTAIRNQDMEGATEAKNAVEERQRERARERGDENVPLRYFRQAGDKYVPLCGVTEYVSSSFCRLPGWLQNRSNLALLPI
jgi:hypothetical protein